MLFALILAAAPVFAEKNPAPLDVKLGASTQAGDVTVRELTFRGAGRDVPASLVVPAGAGPFAGVLFVHWLGETKSNREEFLDEATGLAKRGVVALAIDAPWADKDWFDKKRSPDTDYKQSVDQVIELKRALDVLLVQPNVDAKRIAYVGHDFGAMYGALLASVDARPKTWVLMAGTSRFSDWFLLGDKPKDKDAYVKQISELDPTHFIGKASGSVFFQFAEKDGYVPAARAKEFFEAAKEPKQMRTYPVDHQLSSKDGLNERARWLAKELGLTL